MPGVGRGRPGATLGPDKSKKQAKPKYGKQTGANLDAYSVLEMAGFRGDAIKIMEGIGYAESSGKTDARNKNTDGSVDRGWLQINDRAHPDVSDQCADTPLCAAQAAFRISNNGTNFHPWTTYNDKTYLAFKGKNYQLVGGPSIGKSITDAATGWMGTLNQIAAFFASLFEASTWLRIGKVVAGAVLIIFSINELFKIKTGTNPVAGVTKAAKKTAEVAAVA